MLAAFLVIPLADPAPVSCHVLPGSEPDPADAFGTSNISRSLLLAVRSSTINKAIEYITGSLLTGFTQLPRRSLYTGLRAGWYEPLPSEFASCWLMEIGLISLAFKPEPVEEQPVASTTITPSAIVSNADCLISFTKAAEQWSVSNLPPLERYADFTVYKFIFI
jgi:hypothetical protein